MLQCGDCLFEMENFPDGDAEIQQTDAAHGATHPTGSDDLLQSLNARRARSIQQKIVVAPVAQAPHILRPPRHHRECNADLDTENDVKNDAKLSRHNTPQLQLENYLPFNCVSLSATSRYETSTP